MDIKYVMAAPGMGKTTGAINMLADHLKRIDKDPALGTIFYVAPSKQLLFQTYRNLQLVLRAAGTSGVTKRCRIIHGSPEREHASVADRVYQHLDVVPASVVFLTHQGFLLLRTHPRFANTTVVFDETRQWVMPVTNLRFSTRAKELFNQLFTVESLDNGALCTVSANQVDRKVMRRSLSNIDSDRVFSALLNFHKLISIDPQYGEPRVSAYGMMTVRGAVYNLCKIEVPYLPFRGFKEVYILSARFRSSQMFHLLHRETVANPNLRLVDYSREFLTKWIPDAANVSVRVAQRYRKVVIVPLLGNDNTVLSSHALTSGFISKSMPNSSRAQWFKNGLSELRELESAGDLSAADHPLRITYGVRTDILTWMLDASLEVYKKWSEKFPCPAQPLVFTNHNDQKLRFDFYENRDQMQWVNHAAARGSNSYMRANAVFYLTAVNAHPIVKTLLEYLTPKRLPTGVEEYDTHQDYVVDSALQCLGRGCVRDQDSNDPMLVVVPTLKLAQYLKAAMTLRMRSGGRLVEFAPTISTKFVEHTKMFMRSSLAFNNTRPQLPGTEYLTEEEERRLAAIRTAKSRAKKAGDTAKFNQLEAERIAIRTTAAARAEQ